MELTERRKLLKNKSGVYLITIPPYFIKAMRKEDSEEVILTLKDNDHIDVELVKKGEN